MTQGYHRRERGPFARLRALLGPFAGAFIGVAAAGLLSRALGPTLDWTALAAIAAVVGVVTGLVPAYLENRRAQEEAARETERDARRAETLRAQLRIRLRELRPAFVYRVHPGYRAREDVLFTETQPVESVAHLLEADAHLLDAPTAKLIHSIVEKVVTMRRLPGVGTEEAQQLLDLIDAAIRVVS